MSMKTSPITANASQLGIPMNSRFPMTLPRGISLERLVQKSGNGGDGMSCSPGIFSLCLSDPLIGFCRYSLSLLFLSFFRVFPHEPRNESNPTITDAHIRRRGVFRLNVARSVVHPSENPLSRIEVRGYPMIHRRVIGVPSTPVMQNC